MSGETAGTWGQRLMEAAADVRRSADTAALERTERLLKELAEAVKGGEAVVPVRAEVLALRAELERAETVSRRMAAAEADWARAVWVALGFEPEPEYGSEGTELGGRTLRRLTWEG